MRILIERKGGDVQVTGELMRSKGQLPALTNARLLSLSMGYLGLQITFGIESASLSRLYQSFGAEVDDLALLWLAGPVAGLVVQPLVGRWSDFTWTRWGRRRPWIMGSGMIAVGALVGIAYAPSLAWAIAMVWLLELAMNALNAPYRALVGDTLPLHQQGRGFAMQTVFIGLGAFLGAMTPKLLSLAGVANISTLAATPESIRIAFLLAAACLAVSVGGTVLSIREHGREDYARFGIAIAQRPRDRAPLAARALSTLVMLAPFRRIAAMQFFAWAALYLFWVYATPIVAMGTFGAANVQDPQYGAGADWVGVMFATYNGVAGLFAFLLPRVFDRYGVSVVHAAALMVGGAGFVGVAIAGSPGTLIVCSACIGIAYASLISSPFVLASALVARTEAGTAIGLMNIFIVAPQLVMGFAAGAVIGWLSPGSPEIALLGAGMFCVIAAIICGGHPRIATA
ncbi:MFS transporter [Erythrobacter sp.]|uniref:MFS transporter n=1 Tax=Erythrobacter sp. TaxID=1042 RepID=UPI0025DA8150|nr:MFS transporter [Erythrobacter sp.]